MQGSLVDSEEWSRNTRLSVCQSGSQAVSLLQNRHLEFHKSRSTMYIHMYVYIFAIEGIDRNKCFCMKISFDEMA